MKWILAFLIAFSHSTWAADEVHIVEFVNFSCGFSESFNDLHFDALEGEVESKNGTLVVAPFSSNENGEGLLNDIYWALKFSGDEYADRARSFFFSGRKQGFPLNSRSSIEAFLADVITEEHLQLEGLNYDRLFYLSESVPVLTTQKKALDLVEGFSPINLPFFIFVTADGPVDIVERRDGESMGALANRVYGVFKNLHRENLEKREGLSGVDI